jgi:hypothetical protein
MDQKGLRPEGFPLFALKFDIKAPGFHSSPENVYV